MKYFSLVSIILFSLSAFSSSLVELKKDDLTYYKKAFTNVSKYKDIKIDDPISDNPINVKIRKLFSKDNKQIGFAREINTTTGCNSSCLPVIFTLFYDSNKVFKKVLSRDGLTKLFHAPFSKEDYAKLELILVMNPPSFKKVKHPLDLTDAITGATKKLYQADVVKDAAYSLLRINVYNQHTLKFLKDLK